MATRTEKALGIGGALFVAGISGAAIKGAFDNRNNIDQEARNQMSVRTAVAEILNATAQAESTNTPTPTETLLPTSTTTPIPTETSTPNPTSPVELAPTMVPKSTNPRLASWNNYKMPGKDYLTWGNILNNREKANKDNNLFVLALTTNPEKPSDLGVPSSDPKKNQRLGHTKDVKYYSVEGIVSNAATTKVSDLITVSGEFKMGGFVGDIQAATGLTAVAEIAAEDYEKYKNKTIAELFADKKFVAKANVRQQAILDKRVSFIGSTKKAKNLEGMPSELKDGQDQYDTCEQYAVETVGSKKSGKRSDGKISTRSVKHIDNGAKTFNSADSKQEYVFVPFTTLKGVSGRFIATDRDFAMEARKMTTEETRLWKEMQERWASEDIYQLCGNIPARRGETPIPPKVVVPGQPEQKVTPVKPGETPKHEVTPTPQNPTVTPVIPNSPDSAPTATVRPDDAPNPTLVPATPAPEVEPEQPAPTPDQPVPPTPVF